MGRTQRFNLTSLRDAVLLAKPGFQGESCPVPLAAAVYLMSIQPPSSYPRDINVTEPMTAAYERMKLMLFCPFDLGKWFAIGFCAWLAGLGESGGYHGSFNNFNSTNNGASAWQDLRHAYDRGHEYVLANLAWLVPLVALGVLIVLALGILFLWLSSRGKFMLIHCVALNKAEVVIPWDQYASAANRLFGFRLLFSLAGLVLILPLVVLMVVLILQIVRTGYVGIGRIMPLVGLGAGMVLLTLVFALVQKLMVDFVVPIMYLRGGTCVGAWREFLRLLGGHAADLILYLLFQIVLAIGTLVVLAFLLILTCCTAGCVMVLPYIGTVFLLPILIFKRAYSLYYLAQFGPEFDVFPPNSPPAAPVAPSPGLQPIAPAGMSAETVRSLIVITGSQP
jgi:hypothetical protein